MRKFINTQTDDFWTALKNDRIVESRTKPKPYPVYRELSSEEQTIASCREHFIILFMSQTNNERLKNSKEQVTSSLANLVCESYPELAQKHNLKINREHEYWKK